MNQEEPKGRAAGGHARAESLSKEERKEIAKKAALKRWSGDIKEATHGSPDRPLSIMGIEIPCYVLEDETRVLSQRGLQGGIGMSLGGATGGAQRLAVLMDDLARKGINVKDLPARLRQPIQFKPSHGGRTAYGYEATILADICDVILDARKSENVLTKGQLEYADRCELLVRGFARVGIIALVDEATGYQKDRAGSALARILEAFIAKELQPYVKTFPTDFYEQMYRLRGLEFPDEQINKPSYFGHLTNDIVYKRLAPGVLEELKKVNPKNEKGQRKNKHFQHLTQNTGYPKLREHLGATVAVMKMSSNWKEFQKNMDRLYPRFNDTLPLPLEFAEDTGRGL